MNEKENTTENYPTEPQFKLGDEVWAVIGDSHLVFGKVVGIGYCRKNQKLSFAGYWVGGANYDGFCRFVFKNLTEAERRLDKQEELLKGITKDVNPIKILADALQAIAKK